MGIQATVVHDGVKHRPLVLRALSASPAELHGLSDTIASFSEHIAALRGTVNSPVEVCARWGGPPYISYTVVAKRFRVIVIWADDPGELDLAQDVHDCVVALHDAVVSAADALARDDPAALETVYNAAGAALRGASPPPEVAAQTASAPAPVKRASGLRALFGRTLKSGTGVVTGQSQSRRSAFRPPSARVSARRPPTPPSEEGAAVPKKDEDLPFDDAPSALHLPDSVFTWADFGDPLPPSGGDIAWIAELLRGDAQRRQTARPRILDAPLAQPSEGANAPRDSAVGTPPVGVAIPPPLQEQMLPGPAIPLSAPGAPAVTEQAAPIPQRATAQAAAIVPPSVQPPPSTQPVPVLPAQPVQPSSQTGQSIPVTANGTQSAVPVPPAVPSSAPAGSSVGPTGIASNMPAEMPSAMPAAMPSAIPAPVPAPVVPAVLARPQSSADEFDVSALGGYKDEATQGGGSAGGASGTDAIRGMMNEFAKSMQTGNFQKALAQVSATLRALAGISPRRERETMACAHYALAQKILLRCQVLDRQISTAGAGSVLGIQSAVQAAVLAMFLAELKNLLPRHRLAAMRMALDKNIAVGNFGMAARWIRQIAEKAPPAQRQALGAKLQMCVQNGEVNKHMPPTNKLCYNLLTVLSGPYGKCTVCTAVYRPGLSGVNIGQSCPTCFAGSIVIAQ